MDSNMNTYSCRAECANDLKIFTYCCVRELNVIPYFSEMRPLINLEFAPDRMVEFECKATISELDNILSSITDAHVMRETLKECPLIENDLERNAPDFYSVPK